MQTAARTSDRQLLPWVRSTQRATRSAAAVSGGGVEVAVLVGATTVGATGTLVPAGRVVFAAGVVAAVGVVVGGTGVLVAVATGVFVAVSVAVGVAVAVDAAITGGLPMMIVVPRQGISLVIDGLHEPISAKLSS